MGERERERERQKERENEGTKRSKHAQGVFFYHCDSVEKGSGYVSVPSYQTKRNETKRKIATTMAPAAKMVRSVNSNRMLARGNRTSVVVRATQNESGSCSTRRQMLNLAGAAALFVGARQANAESIALFDDKSKNLDYKNNIADRARDVDIDVKIRNGWTDRESRDFVVKRVAESKKRIESDVKTYVDKASWYAAKQELRRQLGTMSADMNSLVASSSDKKKGASLKKEFFTSIDALDFAIRQKNQDAASKYQAESVAKLNDFLAFAG